MWIGHFHLSIESLEFSLLSAFCNFSWVERYRGFSNNDKCWMKYLFSQWNKGEQGQYSGPSVTDSKRHQLWVSLFGPDWLSRFEVYWIQLNGQTYKQSKYRVSHETWQLVNSLKCLLPYYVKLFVAKENNKYFMAFIL